MPTLYMGLRYPASTYRRISVPDVNLESNLEQIKIVLFQESNYLLNDFGKKKFIFFFILHLKLIIFLF